LFLLIGAAWRTYYFLGLISQTIFPDSVSFAQFTRNSSALPTERAFNQHETTEKSHKNAGQQQGQKGKVRGNKGRERRLRLAMQRDAITLETGLLRFFSLDTLVDLFTVYGNFFGGVYANAYLVTLYPKNRYSHLITNHEGLTNSTSQNQHSLLLERLKESGLSVSRHYPSYNAKK